jgi:hypothetical protein
LIIRKKYSARKIKGLVPLATKQHGGDLGQSTAVPAGTQPVDHRLRKADPTELVVFGGDLTAIAAPPEFHHADQGGADGLGLISPR